MSAPTKVLIIDGECAFCNQSALFIFNKNKKRDITFAASNSAGGLDFISRHNINFDPKKTLIYVIGNKVYDRSSAVLQVSKSMKGLYPVLIIFWIIPKFIRDYIYNFIAKHRYKIIPKKDKCNIEVMSEFKGRLL